MAARTVMGGIFVAILFLGTLYAAFAPLLQPIMLPRVQVPWFTGGTGIIEQYDLVKGTNVSDAVKFIDLNVTVKFGAIFVVFSNKPNLALQAFFEHGTNAPELETNYTFDGNNSLQVSLHGESGSLNLTLGKDYRYDGDLGLRFGAVLMELGQYSDVGKLAVRIRYAGGVLLNVTSGASFEQLDLSMDIGGLLLNINADNLGRNGAINTNITMGGVMTDVGIDTARVGVSYEAEVDTGGLTVDQTYFEGPVSSTHCSVRTHGYASAAKKLDVKANIGAGGGSIQQSMGFGFPGFST
jgi:hypothetical protein